MNKRKVTVVDIANLLGRSRKHTYAYLTNYQLLTINQLYLIAGYFNIPFLELIYLLTKKQKQQTKEDKKTLLDIVEKWNDKE